MKSKRIVLIGAGVALSLMAEVMMAQPAQKISELKSNGESLWTFLGRLPASFEAQIFYAIVLFGIIGMFTNYAVKWMKKQIAGSLINYLFHDNLRGTLLSISTTIGIGIGAITGGVFETASGEFVGWFNVMWIALTNGFMWDSALNNGSAESNVPSAKS